MSAESLNALFRATWIPSSDPAVVIGLEEQTPEQALEALKAVAREVTRDILKGRQ